MGITENICFSLLHDINHTSIVTLRILINVLDDIGFNYCSFADQISSLNLVISNGTTVFTFNLSFSLFCSLLWGSGNALVFSPALFHKFPQEQLGKNWLISTELRIIGVRHFYHLVLSNSINFN